MSEPVDGAAPPAAAGPAAAPQAPPDDFGAALRAAREAAGMRASELAGRLRLHVKQIEALERSDLDALPTLIYVRGFVRSCARELRIDPAPLLAALDRRAGVVPGSAPTPEAGSLRLARLGDGTRPVVAFALLALLIAGVVGTLWPRHGAAPVPAAHPPASVVAPVEPAPADTPVPAPAVTPPAASAAGNGAAAPVNRTLPRPRSAPVPAAPAAPPPEAQPAPPAATAESAPAAPAPAPAPPDLVLRVKSPSWVEVVAANGSTVLSQICPAGSVQTVRAAGPLRLVIGNAAAVEAQYHGAPVDLGRYVNANGVARFTLP